jgi:two-component system response regulator DevR
VLLVALGEATRHDKGMGQEEEDVVRSAVRVFLLDDHEVVRCGLRELLESSGDIKVVGEAARADEALRRIPAVRPDVAVLDARLPDGNGIEVCREIRSSLPSVACLILTSYDDDEALFAAIMAGAAGYLLKQIRGTDLVDAVHRVARGQSLLDPAVTANVLTRLREGPPGTDPQLEALSDRERAVLALIADGLSNREIGTRLYLAEKTVKNHVSRLLAKLQMQRRTQVAVFGASMRDQGALHPQHPES